MDYAPIVALEIGTTKVRALVGEHREDGHIMITGLGECPSRGVRKSEVVDFDNALSCVKTALQAAEESAQVTIHYVHLIVAGGHIQNLVNRGGLPISHSHHQILREDVEDCMENARTVTLKPDQEILHTMYLNFLVDDREGVVNPEGLEGAKLAVDCLILYGNRNRLRSTAKVVKTVPMEVEDVAFSGLCAALAVLTPIEKEHGVAVIDLGGGTTNYIVYADNAIAMAGSLAVGGDHVTNDIARGLRIPTAQAERLKEESGSVTLSVNTRGQRVPLPMNGEPPERFVKMSDLNTIMQLRMEETLSLVKQKMEEGNLLNKLGSGIVFTGGGARTRGLLDLAERVFRQPCTIGQPKDVGGLAAATGSPEYAAPVGMLRYGFRAARRARRGSLWKHLFRK